VEGAPAVVVASASRTAVTVEGLRLTYRQGGQPVHVLEGLSFDAAENELVVVKGPSGSGKTSLLSCIAGLLTPTGGSIRAAGLDVTRLGGGALREYRRRHVGIVFQSFNLIPSLTAVENVAVPLVLDGVPFGRAAVRAAKLLERFGLHERLRHRPGTLSGGERQRVAIARALVREPAVLLADEPTSSLDRHTAATVIELLRGLRAPGRVVLVATHDERLMAIADRTVELGTPPVPHPPRSGKPVGRGSPAWDVGEIGGRNGSDATGAPAPRGQPVDSWRLIRSEEQRLRARQRTFFLSEVERCAAAVGRERGGPAALDPAALDPAALDPAALDPAALDPAALDDVHRLLTELFREAGSEDDWSALRQLLDEALGRDLPGPLSELCGRARKLADVCAGLAAVSGSARPRGM
jgi:ABC-type lipoprotein export system ATPase subunit